MTINDNIQDLIERQVAEGRQIGVQVCAYHRGDVVVDTQAGAMGPADPRPVQPDTLFLSWSTTKGVTATLLHMLVDRGVIDVAAPVARYWPAFAANGKDGITVEQAMSHQAGLHRMPLPFAVEHLTDWEAGLRRIEEASPVYPPGTQTGYHAFTFAWVAGGLIEGATGQRFGDLIQSEIARPLGVDGEMFVGVPDGLDDRLATSEILALGAGMEIPPESEMYHALPAGVFEPFEAPEVSAACLPSANGHFTARALARMYAALAGDGAIDGTRLMSPERVSRLPRLVTDAVDVVVGVPIRKGLGYFLGGSQEGIHGPMSPRQTAFGHSGAGGSVAFADPEAGLAVAVTLNKMSYGLPGEGVTQEICDTIRQELGVA